MLWNAALPSRRWRRFVWIQSYCFVFTCLTTACVFADNLPYDLHQEPCTKWPDQDFKAPCKCTSCLFLPRTTEAIKEWNMVNVAYNRPASVSSLWSCLGGHYYCRCPWRGYYSAPCGAVNGFLCSYYSTGCYHWVMPLNGIFTNDGDVAGYFHVNFERPYTIFYIVYFNIVDFNYPHAYYNHYRLANLYELVDAQVCHTWPNYMRMGEITRGENDQYPFTCTRPIRGSTFRVQKIYQTNFLIGYEVFGLGELQVWVCRSGSYGTPAKGGKVCYMCPSQCASFCDNHYGCTTEGRQMAHNAAIGRPVSASSSNPSYAVDGMSATAMRDGFCYRSYKRGQNGHYVRIELDGVYLLTHVILGSYLGEEYTGYHFKALIRMVTATDGYKAKEICWEKTGGLGGQQYSAPCTSCKIQPYDCPLGRYVTVLESAQDYLRLCEIEAFGVAVKESTVCGWAGVRCQLVLCRPGLVCSNGRCMVSLGGACSVDQDCVDPVTQMCSDISQQCKLRLNAPCVNKENVCYELLQCDVGFTGKCKFKPGENCYSIPGSCLTPFVCDYSSLCKIGTSGKCKTNRDCVAGAICKAGTCQCTENAVQNGNICQPTNPYCLKPLKLGQLFTCVVDLGGACNPGGDKNCDDNAQCLYNTCIAYMDEPCNSSQSAGQCGENAMCDPVVNRCRIKPGKLCSDKAPCVTGAACKTSKTCQIQASDTCSETLNQGTQCQTKHCYIQAWESCSNYPDDCDVGYDCLRSERAQVCVVGNGGLCDEFVDKLKCLTTGSVCIEDSVGDKRCMLDVGQRCTNKLKCREGAECHAGRCRWTISHPCKQGECGEGRKCDTDSVCRINSGQSCSQHPGYCQLRSLCIQGTCSCVESVAENKDDCPLKKEIRGLATTPCNCSIENGKAFYDCLGGAACNDTDKTGTCVCTYGHAIAGDLTCKPDIGSACSTMSASSDVVCANGAICYEGFCVIPPGQPCIDRTWDCMKGSVCEESVCKLEQNGDCSGDRAALCAKGLVCEPATWKCKIPVGASQFYCQTSLEDPEQPCVSGAMCNETDLRCHCQESVSTQKGCMCEGNTGIVTGACTDRCTDPSAECIEGKCVCKKGYEVHAHDLACKLSEGEKCVTSDSCAPGKACDIKTGTCMRVPGSSCNSSRTGAESQCVYGSDCKEGTCQLKINANCSDSPYSCPPDTFCEIGVSNRCKYYQYSFCNYTIDDNACLTGARCNESQCQCDLTLTEEKGVTCSVLPGKVFGKCKLGDSCDDDGAMCEQGVCSCQQGQVTNLETLSCMKVGASKADDGHSESERVAAIVLGVLATAAVGAVAVALAAQSKAGVTISKQATTGDVQTAEPEVNNEGNNELNNTESNEVDAVTVEVAEPPPEAVKVEVAEPPA